MAFTRSFLVLFVLSSITFTFYMLNGPQYRHITKRSILPGARNGEVAQRCEPLVAQSTTLPAGWSVALSCAVDTSSRVLGSYGVDLSTNTPAICISACAKKGYTYAGVEDGYQCFCGSSYNGGTPASGTGCTTVCPGDSSQTCGGSYRIQIYTSSSTSATATGRSTPDYTLTDWYDGTNIFDEFDFYSSTDPTHGYVDYQTKEDAMSLGLAYSTSSGAAVIKLDNTTTLSSGAYRNSVRISSSKTWNSGLFIADLSEMPWGCSLWPAYWTLGSGTWPYAGEIDIVEGVNLQDHNQVTLHTSSGCSLSNDGLSTTSSYPGNTDCDSTGSSNTGCYYDSTDTQSYGSDFNSAGGGVFAHILNSTGIYVWFFTRESIPADITTGIAPQPDTWAAPMAIYTDTSCDIASHFVEQSLVFDITLCGDWAGSAYPSSSCPSTTGYSNCIDVVANPDNYPYSAFTINYIKVFSEYAM